MENNHCNCSSISVGNSIEGNVNVRSILSEQVNKWCSTFSLLIFLVKVEKLITGFKPIDCLLTFYYFSFAQLTEECYDSKRLRLVGTFMV